MIPQSASQADEPNWHLRRSKDARRSTFTGCHRVHRTHKPLRTQTAHRDYKGTKEQHTEIPKSSPPAQSHTYNLLSSLIGQPHQDRQRSVARSEPQGSSCHVNSKGPSLYEYLINIVYHKFLSCFLMCHIDKNPPQNSHLSTHTPHTWRENRLTSCESSLY